MSWAKAARARALLVGALLASSALRAIPASAQPRATTARRGTVSLVVAGPDARILEDTIRELLARLDVGVVTGGSTRASNVAAIDVQIDAAGTAHVLVRSASGSTVIDRLVPHEANAAIQREQIAHAVRGAVEAELLLEEERRARPSSPEPPPAPPPTSEPPPPPPAEPVPTPAPAAPAPAPERPVAAEGAPATRHATFAVDLATFAGAGAVGEGAGAVARVGGAVAIASRRGLRPALAISALYAFPFTSGSDTLGARSNLVSVRALPSVEVLRRSWLALEVGAGGGVDVLSVEPSSTTLPASALHASTSRVDPILTAQVTGRIAIASDVTFLVTVASDADLATRRYVFDDRGSRSEVLSPWSVRPTVLAGLSFTAFGEAPFARGGGR